MNASSPKLTLYNQYSDNILYIGKAVDFLTSSVPAGSADIIFLDPPFNLGKKYSQSATLDNLSESAYGDWLCKILDLSIEALKPGGALYLYHLPEWAMRCGIHLDGRLTFQHWIAVSMKNSFARGNKLYPAHYALLYFSKGVPVNFSRPRIDPQRCRHCDQYVKDYGGYRDIIDAKGVNLSDVWDDLSPVRHEANKHRDANEIPPKLVRRVVEISGVSGGMFVDPFVGSGNSVCAAVNEGMVFLACDIVPENIEIVDTRIREIWSKKETVVE